MLKSRLRTARALTAAAILGLAACSGDSTRPEEEVDLFGITRVTVGDESGHLFWIDAQTGKCPPYDSCPFGSELAVPTGAQKTVVVTLYPKDARVLQEEIRVHLTSGSATWVSSARTGNSLTGTMSCTTPGLFEGAIELWSQGKRVWSADKMLGACVNG